MQYFNDPDTIRPTLASYSLDKFGKGVRSVCCVLNPDTGNTNTLVGGGDGTVSFINQSLNKVRDVNAVNRVRVIAAYRSRRSHSLRGGGNRQSFFTRWCYTRTATTIDAAVVADREGPQDG